tara:strand:+ start:186 stop:944 length:759 start_codon:yes stop_codon:yes gene_type:complete
MSYSKDAYENAVTNAASEALNLAKSVGTIKGGPAIYKSRTDGSLKSKPEVGSLMSRPTYLQERQSNFKESMMSYLVAENKSLADQASVYGDRMLKEDELLRRFGVNLEPGPKDSSTRGSEEVSGTVAKIVNAISMSESSGGKNTNHPLVKKGMYKGQRAIGEYAIMPGNVSQWTKQALGYEMSVEDFKDNPDAQAYVTEYKINEYYNKYGTVEDAASVWFTGKPVREAGNVSDGYTTAPEYLQKFMGFYKGR